MEDAPTQPAQPPERTKRVHTLLAAGYLGGAYNGSQMQNGRAGTRTIENEIANALERLGHVPDGDMRKLSFERASRTDSKVSAALTVFSFYAATTSALAEDLNHILPEDIRCFFAQRTTPRFDVRAMCTSRKYEYVLPVEMLRKSGQFDSVEADYSQFLDENEEGLKLTVKPIEFVSNHIQFKQWPASQTLEEIVQFFNDQVLVPLNALASMYTSKTQHYHNFTSEEKIQSINSTSRKYETFVFQPARIVNGQVFSTASIHGTAFLYNQIRKMIAALVLVARGQCPPAWMSRALTGRTEFKTDIPTAPGQYLLLCRQEFKGHEHSQEANMYGQMLSDREDVKQMAEEFKMRIYEEISHTDPAVWGEFLAQMNIFAEKQSGYDLAKAAIKREIEIGKFILANKVVIDVVMK